MQSKIIAIVVPDEGLEATLLVRRATGQFALQRIDARVAVASRLAADWSRDSSLAESGQLETV
jgi:hypothetical protein